MRKFISEIFQDTDGGASSKRMAFFIFILLYCGIAMGVVLHGLSPDVASFASGIMDKTGELIKWIGGFILGDKAPAMLAAFKGKSSDGDPNKTGG